MQQPSRTDDSPAGRRGSVLLADDRPAERQALRDLLADLGPDLVEAASADEALCRLADGDFAVVILHAEAHGHETARLIRAREKGRRTPIIFLVPGEGDR